LSNIHVQRGHKVTPLYGALNAKHYDVVDLSERSMRWAHGKRKYQELVQTHTLEYDPMNNAYQSGRI